MQKRPLWQVIVFGILTLGIYDLYWLYATRREMVQKGQKIPPFWLIFAPLLLLLAVAVLQFIVRFILSSAGSDAAADQGDVLAQIINIISVLVGVIALLAIIPVGLYWTYKYCVAVEAVTKGRLTLAMNFIMMILLSFLGFGVLWPAIVQDAFNKTK